MRSLAILAVAETRRYLFESYRYLANYVTSWVSTALIIAIFALASGSRSDPSYWIGLMFWTAVSNIISEACISLNEDKQTGTFTQLMVKPTSILRQVTVKTLVWGLINTVFYALFCLLVFSLLGFPVGFNLWTLLIMLLVLTGAFGFTLVMAGLVIVYSKASAAMGIVEYLLLLFSGAVVPLSVLPTGLVWFGQLLPTTLGISLARASIRGDLIQPSQWVGLAAQSVVYLLLGYLVFVLVMRRGRRHGINMRY